MKKVKILVVIIILMIFILILLLFCLNNMNYNNVNKIHDNDIILGLDETPGVGAGQISPIRFHIVQRCITKYLDNINKNNSAYYGKDNSGNYVKIIKEEDIKKIIYNQLSKEYINKNNIDKTNVYNFVDDITEKQIFNVLKIRLVENENSDQYIVYGFLQNSDNKFTKYKCFIVNIDDKNNIYSIEPVEDIIDINKIIVQDEFIEKNENNILPNVLVNAESNCREYFNLFKRIMLSKPEEAYELLDKEYREKRFGNVDEFKNYVNINKNELSKISLNQYYVSGNGKNKEYVCKDLHDNLYIFSISAVTEYNVKLDTYTLLTEDFKDTYNAANEQQKTQMNINKWIQMLNNRDYKSAYDVLDSTFRENTFKNLETFEKYMRIKYPLYYSTQFIAYNRNGDLHVVTVNLADVTGKKKEVPKLDFVMKLEEDYKYFMSFDI